MVFGNVMQSASDAIYLARHVGLRAGLLVETPAVTVNRLCGSGFESIVQGAQLIELGETDAVLAGGAESMSLAPHLVRGARWGLRLGPPPPMEDMLWSALTDSHCNMSMAQTAERLADQYNLPRVEVDDGGAPEPAARQGRVGFGRVRRRGGAGSAHRSQDPRDGAVGQR